MLDLDLSAQNDALRATFREIRTVIDTESLQIEIARLSKQAGAQDIWDDRKVLIELANESHDEESAAEARTELTSLQQTIGDLEVQTLLDGEWDARPAVITIRSGAGGVDAADFAEMLLRMYLRWAEKRG